MERGQDQIVGRAAAGLAFTHDEFGILPPHFNPAESSVLPPGYTWRDVLPGYTSLPTSFQGVLPFLLASLAHHLEFITKTYPADHSFFHTPIYTTGLLAKLQPRVYCVYACLII